ncbi:MAG: glycosyltransferase, partial [Oscillibacter sp.]|nr:glycosyltransferase [Oscillibacter sp.]
MSEHTVFRPIYLPQNKGLGNALREALEHCSHELVARMDSDDISFPYRFALQIEAFRKHPDADIVGGSITEFAEDPAQIMGQRSVELDDAAIKADMKKRCAMNHVSVMYKKSAVLSAGGYLDWHYNED